MSGRLGNYLSLVREAQRKRIYRPFNLHGTEAAERN